MSTVKVNGETVQCDELEVNQILDLINESTEANIECFKGCKPTEAVDIALRDNELGHLIGKKGFYHSLATITLVRSLKKIKPKMQV